MKYTRNNGGVPGHVERRESEINALIRGMYAGADTSTQPELKGFDATESLGYDPYNSGIFKTLKSRKLRSQARRVF